MAEEIVCFVITTEAKLSRDVCTEVGFIKDELESIRSFLKDADAKAVVQGEMRASFGSGRRRVRGFGSWAMALAVGVALATSLGQNLAYMRISSKSQIVDYRLSVLLHYC
ncbi:Hypothetical predicted protein [Prunus dulcis]|uniref:Disease resistance N-terminal domain-containing protein n=1 Tax=Prunus dulcis TaxID=3755 RepID=A0A5E4EB48_PRUDU|nr:Hypothetical predicted protein [Prunus dulcis]